MPTDPTDRATVTELQDALEVAFGKFDDLLDTTIDDGGCEHEDDFACWNCRQRMFVLTLLPVLESCCAEAVREERAVLTRSVSTIGNLSGTYADPLDAVRQIAQAAVSERDNAETAERLLAEERERRVQAEHDRDRYKHNAECYAAECPDPDLPVEDTRLYRSEAQLRDARLLLKQAEARIKELTEEVAALNRDLEAARG